MKRRFMSLFIMLVLMMSNLSLGVFADNSDNSEKPFDAEIISAEWLDSNTAQIEFDKSIELAEDAKSKVQYDGPSFIKKNLSDSDSISVSSKTVTVQVTGQRVADTLYIGAGAIKTADSDYNSSTITINAVLKKIITNVSYNPTQFDSSGGTVSVSLSGKNLYTYNEWLTAKIYRGDELFRTVELDENATTFSFAVPENTGTETVIYSVRYMSSRMEQYAKPVEVQNGADALITVAGRGQAAEPEVNEVSYSSTSLKALGGKITVSLKGEALTQISDSDFSVVINGAEAEGVNVEYNAKDDKSATAEFILPANTSETEDAIYTFIIKKGVKEGVEATKEIRVKAVNHKPLVERIDYDLTNLHDRTSLYYVGGDVTVTLQGDNMDKVGQSDFKFELDGETVNNVVVSAVNMTNSLADMKLTFPQNTLEEARGYTITILSADENAVNRVFNLPIDAAPQDSSDKFQIRTVDWSAATTDKGVVRVRINAPQGLSLGVDRQELSDYIFFSDSNVKPYTNIRKLNDDDEVSMADNEIIINLKDKDAKIPYYIVFKTGSLKDGRGNILGNDEFNRDHVRYVQQEAHIEKISYNHITFDSNGGEVIATVEGSELYRAGNEFRLSAKVFKDSEKDYFLRLVPEDASITNDITQRGITVNADGKSATIKFTVPENKTNRTISYRLTPVIDNINTVPQYVQGYDVISVLPKGAKKTDTTLSSVEIQGAYDLDDELDVFKTSTSAEQFTSKIDVIIRGTNLSGRRTKIKAVDENGVVWPMLPVFECGATIRWQNSSTYLPEKPSKNEQHIELMLPRRLGVPHEFVLQFAPDGENFLDEPTAKVIIDNRGLYDIEAIQAGMFTKDDFSVLKDVEVKYVDKNGNELAPSDHYKGYGITELYHQGIAPKEIEGYTLSGYSPSSLNSMLKQPIKHTSGEYIFDEGQWFIKDLKGQPIVYKYKRIGDTDDRTNDKDGGNNQSAISVGSKVSVAGNSYVVKTVAASGKNGTVIFKKAANKKKVTVPATIKSSDGKTYKVVGIASNAFKKTKVKTITVKTKNLTKKSVKGSLKGSKVKTVQVKIGKKKVNKKYVKKYKKIFTKKNAGKKVKVK